VHGLADIAKVAAGDDHSAALSKDGRTVYTWGREEHGQLGRRQKLFVGAPGKSERLSTKNSEEVAIHDVFAWKLHSDARCERRSDRCCRKVRQDQTEAGCREEAKARRVNSKKKIER